MELSELATGEKAVIVHVDGHGSFRKRLIEMGFIQGKEVRVILNAPLRDPIEYEIIGYKVSLRREEAAQIEVASEEEAREALRDFQERWNAIGFVPFKEKARIQDAFRKAISEKFGEFRDGASRFAGKAERAVRSERDRLVQKFMKKEQEIGDYLLDIIRYEYLMVIDLYPSLK